MAIKTVAVVGAAGNVGAEVVDALLAAGFSVTAISRPESKSTFPSEVAVRRADPTSVEELTRALAGQDAVVSASATAAALAGQDPLIDAAVAAGVKRFVPSEYGHNSARLEEGEILKTLLAAKEKTTDYLAKQTETHPEFSWTGIATSLFFDWGLDMGTLGISLNGKTATIFDSGDEVFSTSSLPFIGRAVAAALQHEEESRNKLYDVIEFNTTQNELLKIFEEETGAQFAVTRARTTDVDRAGREKLAKGDHSAFVDFLFVYNYRDDCGHAITEEEQANRILGLPKSDLREAVKAYIRKNSA